MRLSPQQVDLIRGPILDCDPEANLLLFGSRTNDTAQGGDIDVLCLSDKIGRQDRRRLRREISDRLGGQKIDLLVATDTSKPFVRLVMQEAVPLVVGSVGPEAVKVGNKESNDE
jgi:predicted nucleotidyltransferase